MKVDDARSLTVAFLQLFLILILLIGFAQSFLKSSLLLVQGFLALLYLIVLFNGVRKYFKQEQAPYLFFFLFLLVIVLASSVFAVLPQTAYTVQSYFIIALLLSLLVFILAFKVFYGRNWTVGVVQLSDQKQAVVKTSFDLLSFSNKGVFAVKASKKYPKGTKVKVKVKSTLFSRKPEEIISKF